MKTELSFYPYKRNVKSLVFTWFILEEQYFYAPPIQTDWCYAELLMCLTKPLLLLVLNKAI